MNLSQYLEHGQMSLSEFAKRAGISRSYMSEIAAGLKTPSLEMALKIHEATGESVPLKSLIKAKEAAR